MRGKRIENIHAVLAESTINTKNIIVHVGTNNIKWIKNSDEGDSVTVLMNKYDKMFRELSKRANAKIYFSSMLQRSDSEKANNTITLVNERLASLCQRHGVEYINNANVTELKTDGLHPKPSGYSQLAVNIKNAANSWGSPYQRRQNPPRFQHQQQQYQQKTICPVHPYQQQQSQQTQQQHLD